MDFLKILKSMTEADDIGYSDICVMAVITTYAQYNDDHIVEMSIPDIQAEFKRLSIKTIKRSIKRLTDNNYIQVIQTKGQKNKYKVLIPIGQADKPIKYRRTAAASADPDVEKYKVLINRFDLFNKDGSGD